MDVTRHSSTLMTAPADGGPGLPVAVALHAPTAGHTPLPVTVVCHGFKGFKDWGLFPFLCDRLAASGRAALRFDFSHNGIGDVPGEFTRLDLFREQTATLARADLTLVLDALSDGRLAADVALSSDGISVVGHSMGGGVALLAAAGDRRIERVATLNGVGSFDRFGPGAKSRLEQNGELIIVNTRTGQELPLGRAWFDDLVNANVEAAARSLHQPVLVVQGEADVAVTPEEGRRLAEWIPQAQLLLIEGGDHVLGARHPFVGTTPALDAALEALDRFLPTATVPAPQAVAEPPR